MFSLDAGTGIYKFGNNTYPRRIRGRSNLGNIFRGEKCVLWTGKHGMWKPVFTMDVGPLTHWSPPFLGAAELFSSASCMWKMLDAQRKREKWYCRPCLWLFGSCPALGTHTTAWNTCCHNTAQLITTLYAFFWVIPRRLEFICRRFGTLCLFHLHMSRHSTHIYLPVKMEQSVPKRQHINSRRRGITQKKLEINYNDVLLLINSTKV